MNRAHRQIREELYRSRGTGPIQGYIPVDGIRADTRTATVFLPRVGLGIALPDPDDEKNYVRYDNVPISLNGQGTLDSLVGLVRDYNLAVTVGFRGGSQDHPYIVGFHDPFHFFRTRETQKVGTGREGAISRRMLGSGPSALPPLERKPFAEGVYEPPVFVERGASAPARAGAMDRYNYFKDQFSEAFRTLRGTP